MISLLCRNCGAGAKRFEIPGASTIETTFNYCKVDGKNLSQSEVRARQASITSAADKSSSGRYVRISQCRPCNNIFD